MRRLIFAAAVAAVLPLAGSGCAVNPATGASSFNLLSPADEAKMGQEAHAQILRQFGGPIRDAKLTAYVERIGRAVAAASERKEGPWTFTVLESPQVNAFALPGGYVYITRGLLALAGSEAELAGVLAHEVGHVVARHPAQRYSRGVAAEAGAAALGALLGADLAQATVGAGAAALLQSYSRDQELEADGLGVRYLARAGYDPRAMASLLAKLEAEAQWRAATEGGPSGDDPLSSLLASHPRTLERVQKAIAEAQAAHPAGSPRKLEVAAYLDRIQGLVWGDSPDEGVVQGRSFIHPSLRLSFTVPDGFRLENTPERVTAQGPRGAALAFDVAEAAGRAPDAHLAEWARRAGPRGVERLTVQNRPAATGLVTLKMADGPATVRLIVIEDRPGRMLRFQALVSGDADAAADGLAHAALDSLRFLTAAEAAQVKPRRLVIVAAPAGDALERRVAAQPVAQPRRLFEVLNGLGAGERPPVGTKIKLIE